jgi:hypothetical protein
MTLLPIPSEFPYSVYEKKFYFIFYQYNEKIYKGRKIQGPTLSYVFVSHPFSVKNVLYATGANDWQNYRPLLYVSSGENNYSTCLNMSQNLSVKYWYRGVTAGLDYLEVRVDCPCKSPPWALSNGGEWHDSSTYFNLNHKHVNVDPDQVIACSFLGDHKSTLDPLSKIKYFYCLMNCN